MRPAYRPRELGTARVFDCRSPWTRNASVALVSTSRGVAVGFVLTRSQEGTDNRGGVGCTFGVKVEVVAFVRLLTFCLASGHRGDGSDGFDNAVVVTRANVTVECESFIAG